MSEQFAGDNEALKTTLLELDDAAAEQLAQIFQAYISSRS